MKELMESSYLSVMSEQNDKLREEIKHLQSVIDKAIEYLKRKEKEPEWYDTDFMICINILNGGSGNFDEILRSKE